MRNDEKLKRVRENVPEVEGLIAKTVLWNNSKLKLLDDDEVQLEEDLDAISENVKILLDSYIKTKATSNDSTNNNLTKNVRKHSFIQKYLDRKADLVSRGRLAS